MSESSAHVAPSEGGGVFLEEDEPLYLAWLRGLSDDDFDDLLDAADEFFSIHRSLAHDELTILSELLRDQPDWNLIRWQHYPQDDVEDPTSGALFYYHAHDRSERPADEHGHFHLFVRPHPDDEFSHFVALSLNAQGEVRSAFTTNRWVTDEQIRPAQVVLDWLPEHFVIDRARPSWLISRWLMRVPQLIWPQIVRLLQARDRALGWSGEQALPDTVAEDRTRQVLSEMPINLFNLLMLIQTEGQRRYQA